MMFQLLRFQSAWNWVNLHILQIVLPCYEEENWWMKKFNFEKNQFRMK